MEGLEEDVPSTQRRQLLPLVGRPTTDEREHDARSRSSRGAGERQDVESVSNPSSDPLPVAQNTIVREELKNIHSDVLAAVSRHANELNNKIEGIQKANSRIAVCDDRVAKLKSGTIPPGIPPFRTGTPSVYMGKPMSSEETRFEIVIPAGKSFMDAKRIIYTSYQEFMTNVDKQVATRQRADYREFCKKSNFIALCKSAAQSFTTTANTLDLDLEDEGPVEVLGTSASYVTSKAESIWQRVVDKAAARKIKQEKLKHDVDERKKKVVESLASTSPQDWLNQTIDQRIRAATKSRPKAKAKLGKGGKSEEFVVEYDRMFIDRPLATPDNVGDYVTKNETSPGDARGQSSKQSTKSPPSKGKGRGKPASSKGGKSKGKSKGPSKQKGTAFNQDSAGLSSRGRGRGRGRKGAARGRGRGKGKGKA